MAQVKVILLEDVPKLGEAGDLVSVKPGYARNFLLAGGKASQATEARVKAFEHQKRVVAAKVAKELQNVEAVQKRLESLQLKVTAQAGEEGKLFGSVTSQQIAELLAEQGFEFDRRKIVMDEPIKSLGEHTVPIKLHRELTAQVKLVVEAQE